MKPVVANIRESYLRYTETFIYRHLISQVRHEPIVLTKKIENASLFPFPSVFRFDVPLNFRNRLILKAFKGVFGLDQSSFERFNFRRLIKCRSASLIHVHFLSDAARLLNVLSGSSLPIVVSCYGYDVTSFPKEKGRLDQIKRMFRLADAFIVLSDYMKDVVVELGCPEEKISIIHQGIELPNYKNVERPKKSDNIILMQVASFYEKKGTIYTLQAFSILLKRYPELRLILVGDGPLRLQIEKFINDNGLAEKVTLMGTRPYHELPFILEKADIFIHPSVTAKDGDMEGVPTVLMEAAAAGLPIVSTMHSGINVTVIDSKTGFLVPEKDVEGLVRRTSDLIENPELRLKYGHEARLLAEENFSTTTQVAKVEDLYDKLIPKR